MARKIVVCLDGTWNRDEQDAKFAGPPTNVVKLADAIDRSDPAQRVFHLDGVGTKWGQKVRGGALGYGLFEQIKQGYGRIVDAYEPGDQLFLFGFSRGAYCARSLAGFIARCGVLRRDKLDEVRAMRLPADELLTTEDNDRPLSPPTAIDKAFVMYKLAYNPARAADIADFKARCAHDTDIALVGVWDTVGSLGLPARGFLEQVEERVLHLKDKLFGFLDTRLSDRVKAAYHALAIDEFREPFLPTLWDGARVNQPGSDVEQVWFAGAHSNVGGGYRNTGLSDIALAWMMERAKRHGLVFSREAPQGDPGDTLNDSLGEFLGGLLRPFIRTTRVIAPGSWIHESVAHRLAIRPDYQPRALAVTGAAPRALDPNRYRVVSTAG